MVSGILNFRATKCPIRAAVGHVKNDQVPFKNSLYDNKNKERALRAG